jgi:hypothetical protein
MTTDDIPAREIELKEQYKKMLEQLGKFVKDNHADGIKIETIYFALCNAMQLTRAQMRILGFPDRYMQELERTARNNAITTFNQRGAAGLDAGN